ncbi:MAG TPA: SdpI family protein [Paludibacter sp.]
MNKYLKESVFWILILLPFVYLLTIWKTLPELVPTHFDLLGNPNGWSDKNGLILLIGGMGIGTYILMLLIPKFDPKKKIEQMGDKYYSLRLLLTIFMSLLSIYILYAGNGSKINPNLLIALIGALYAILGNYFQTLKPNYFIGIRTPWTLENEQIWKKTHRLAGRLWIAGGLLTIIISFLINSNLVLVIFFGIITTIIVLVPLVFSYTEFQKTH